MKLQKSFLEIFEKILSRFYDDSYKTRKRKEIEYIKEIINLLYSCPCWSRYNGKIDGKYLNKKHLEYINKGIYNEFYKVILTKYIKVNKYDIFKFISTDTCFIYNKYCKKLSRNKYYKSKRGLKISAIVDATGIPLSLIIKNGNINDCKLFEDTYNNLIIDTNATKYKNSNRHKQYFLADKGYDTKHIKYILRKKGYIYIVPQNKRNIKNKSKIKKLTKKHKNIYKKRIIVENYFSWIKQFSKLTSAYESCMNNYLMLVKLASTVIMFNRMCV